MPDLEDTKNHWLILLIILTLGAALIALIVKKVRS